MRALHFLPRPGSAHHLTGRLSVLVAAMLMLLTGAAAAGGDNNYVALANYVALGDSYAAGVGAGGHLAQSGSCERSTLAYPALWAATQQLASFQSAACSGASTASVASGQLSALSKATSMVSITVGGNDVGFSSIMTDCVLKGSSTCLSEVNAAETHARATLPDRLANLFSAIRARSPRARVVVLDYPHIYDLAHRCLGIAEKSRAKIDEGIDVLDGIIQTASARSGFIFADVRSTFAGHEICDQGRWLHSVRLVDLTESYHPTATGQARGYLPAMRSALT